MDARSTISSSWYYHYCSEAPGPSSLNTRVPEDITCFAVKVTNTFKFSHRFGHEKGMCQVISPFHYDTASINIFE